MELYKVFYEFLIVTIPAVVLYFIGWGYIYYYLDAFGISIAEIHTDAPTIFLYSLPVVQHVLPVVQHVLLKYMALFIIFFIFLPGVLLGIYWQSDENYRNNIKNAFAVTRSRAATMSVWAKLAIMIIVLWISAFGMVPIIDRAALDTAKRVWNDSAVVIALPRSETPLPSDPIEPSPWKDQYDACSKQESLRLIYSDDSTYYLLCTNDDDKSGQGVVFEVRRKEGLISVRFAQVVSYE